MKRRQVREADADEDGVPSKINVSNYMVLNCISCYKRGAHQFVFCLVCRYNACAQCIASWMRVTGEGKNGLGDIVLTCFTCKAQVVNHHGMLTNIIHRRKSFQAKICDVEGRNDYIIFRTVDSPNVGIARVIQYEDSQTKAWINMDVANKEGKMEGNPELEATIDVFGRGIKTRTSLEASSKMSPESKRIQALTEMVEQLLAFNGNFGHCSATTKTVLLNRCRKRFEALQKMNFEEYERLSSSWLDK